MIELEKWQRVGERVGALIRTRGYKTVELFAHENGVDKSVLNRLIRGKREVRLSTFLKILDALNINITELYPNGGNGTREKDAAPARSIPKPGAAYSASRAMSLTVWRSAKPPATKRPWWWKPSAKRSGRFRCAPRRCASIFDCRLSVACTTRRVIRPEGLKRVPLIRLQQKTSRI
jgi:transcriptional regulator with XRE-family HTH domain